MNNRAKLFFRLFFICLVVCLLLLVSGFYFSARMFLEGLPFMMMFYFVSLLALVFLGIAVANIIIRPRDGDHSSDVSALAGIIGFLIFGISFLPLQWYVNSGVGVSSTLSFLGFLLMAISVIEIVRKQMRK